MIDDTYQVSKEAVEIFNGFRSYNVIDDLIEKEYEEEPSYRCQGFGGGHRNESYHCGGFGRYNPFD